MNKNYKNITLLLLFSSLSFIGVLHHEIWLDEAHHWLLARDSHSLKELWTVTRYEGHPILWNLLLYVITCLTNDPFWMQILHWIISIIAVTLFLFLSPLPLRLNALFIFSYFIFYEYTVISRNYSLLLVAFFLALRFYATANYTAFGLSLFFLANTHLWGLVLAGWLMVITLFSFDQKLQLTVNRGVLISFLLFVCGALISLVQISPPENSPFSPQLGDLFSFRIIDRTLAAFLKAFLPLPDIRNYGFWNSNIFTAVSIVLAGILSVFLMIVTVGVLSGKRKALVFFLGFSCSIITLTSVLYYASIAQGVRHFGVLFVVFVGSLWISYSEPDADSSFKLPPAVKSIIITGLLSVQIVAAFIALCLDIKRPFSESKNVVLFLRENNLSEQPVITFVAPIPTISAYLERPIYSMPSGKLESSFKWERRGQYMHPTPDSVLLSSMENFVKRRGESAILITYLPAPHSKYIKLLKEFKFGAVKSENFYVYEVSIPN